MNQELYQVWIVSLPKLSILQLVDLSTRIKLLSKGANKSTSGKQEFGDRVLNIICDVMRKNKVETPSPTTLRKSSAYASSKEKLADLATFLDTISQSKLVQDAILKEGINLLYLEIQQWQGISISSHTILKQIHRISATLNRAYPGYAASGMLTAIIKGA